MIWEGLDKDGDGKVTAAEIALRLRLVHRANQMHIAETDQNEDQIKVAMENPEAWEQEEFKKMDKDGDGNVTEAEANEYTNAEHLEAMAEEEKDGNMTADMKKEMERE